MSIAPAEITKKTKREKPGHFDMNAAVVPKETIIDERLYMGRGQIEEANQGKRAEAHPSREIYEAVNH